MKKAPFFLKNYKTILLISSIALFAVCCKSTKPAASTNSNQTSAATTNTNSSSSNGSAGISYTTSTTTSSLAPAESDVAIAQAHWPDVTMAGLKVGYSLYNDKCTDCHEAKLPQDFTVEEWNGILPKMGRKAKLDSAQYILVSRYVLTRREAIVGVGK